MLNPNFAVLTLSYLNLMLFIKLYYMNICKVNILKFQNDRRELLSTVLLG